MAVQKSKTSKQRTNTRFAQWKLETPNLSECPNCHDIIYLDESMLEEEEMACPGCGTRLEFEFECECSCGCGDDCDCPPECECGCNSDK